MRRFDPKKLTANGPLPIWPLCSDDDQFLYPELSNTIVRNSMPHRAAWGIFYSPARNQWLVKRQDAFGGFYDLSCADHVCIVARKLESYTDTYSRALRETLSLKTAWMTEANALRSGITLPRDQALTVDLGYSKEYNWIFTQDQAMHLEREHVHMFLTFYDGELQLATPSASIAWQPDTYIRGTIDANTCVISLAHTFARCESFISRVTLRSDSASP